MAEIKREKGQRSGKENEHAGIPTPTVRGLIAIAGVAIAAHAALANQIDVIVCKKGGHPKASIAGWIDSQP